MYFAPYSPPISPQQFYWASHFLVPKEIKQTKYSFHASQKDELVSPLQIIASLKILMFFARMNNVHFKNR